MKKFLCVLLSAILGLSLTACGGGKAEGRGPFDPAADSKTLLETQDVMSGLKEGGTVFVNSTRTPEELGLTGGKVIAFDADSISLEILRAKISNTAMMAVAALHSGIAGLEAMEAACREILPERVLEKNLAIIRRVCKEIGEVRA